MEITTAVHWLRGTTVRDADSVLGVLSSALDESVVVLGFGHYGYVDGYLVGGVKVYAHPDRPEMGTCLEFDGSTCEALGFRSIAEVASVLDLRASRFDIALDGCGFAPDTVRHAWQSDRVRTRCKIPKDAREDRQWRTCKWHESPTGDTFSMGSRSSTQHARVYDSRGFTRFELELSGDGAHQAFVQLASLVDAPDLFAEASVSWLRRFVDFVDPDSDSNRSRADLLSWWSAFVGAAGKAHVQLEAGVRRTIEDVHAWVEHQVGPALALIEHVMGFDELRKLAAAGRRRWSRRHESMLATSMPRNSKVLDPSAPSSRPSWAF